MSTSLAAGLEDRAVLVTGVARGIGRAIADSLCAHGARVCGVDLTEEGANAFLEGAEDPGRHLAIAQDLTDLDAQAALLQRTTDELGELAALIHVAGVAKRQQLDDVSESDWDLQTDVNMKATFFLNRAVGNLLRDQGKGGAIVNFTSQGWWTGGFGGSVVYCAGKGGIVSITRGLARTFGPHGIRVNVIAPGLINTPMLTTDITEEALSGLAAQVPLGRIGEPDEVAGTAVFLASDHARYISGATINVTGAWLMY